MRASAQRFDAFTSPHAAKTRTDCERHHILAMPCRRTSETAVPRRRTTLFGHARVYYCSPPFRLLYVQSFVCGLVFLSTRVAVSIASWCDAKIERAAGALQDQRGWICEKISWSTLPCLTSTPTCLSVELSCAVCGFWCWRTRVSLLLYMTPSKGLKESRR